MGPTLLCKSAQHPRARRGGIRTALQIILAAGIWTGSAAGQDRPSELGEGAYRERIVKHFDFSEPNNLGDTPKYWEEFGGDSFPKFVGGGVDRDVGCESPPAFYLDAKGRSVAFRYTGGETAIGPHADYLVVGWIRPQALHRARATMTAYYLDSQGLPLAGTQRQARLVGGDDDAERWRRVQVLLPAGPPQAAAVGITLWVEQAEIWDPEPRPPHHIERRDVRAGAWFDDIVIYRLPRMVLSTTAPGHVFVKPETASLMVTITDGDPRGLSAGLEITDASGNIMTQTGVAAPCGDQTVTLPELEAGHYRARLSAFSGGANVAEQDVAFAVLNDFPARRSVPAHSFGVTLAAPRAMDGAAPQAEAALIRELSVGAVQVPLWTGRSEAPGFAEHPRALDELLDALLRRRVEVTGVLGGAPPEVVRRAGMQAGSVLDMFSGPVENWRDLLNAGVAPYAGVLAAWQVGADGDSALAEDVRLPAVLTKVRQELLNLLTSPRLTAPGTVISDPAGQALPVERVTLTVPRGIQPDWIGRHLQAYRNLGYTQVAAYIEAPPAGPYDRLGRLADWTTRVIEARHAGADIVHIPAPWRRRVEGTAETLEPTEDFVAYRTLVAMLGEAEPDGHLAVDRDVRGLLFTQGQRSLLAIWDPRAPPQGMTHDLQLGEALEAVDLWGRSTPLARGPDGLHRMTLTALPQFVRGIERWVAAFGREVRLAPEAMEFGLGAHRHRLRLANPSDGPLTGEISLDVPDTWQVRPRRIDFSIPAGEEFSREVELRYGRNEGAGRKTLWADVRLREGYRLRVPLHLELGLADLDVWGYAAAGDGEVIVRHGLRNRSGAPVSFRSTVAALGRGRQQKLILSLAPGMSEVKEYRFSNDAALSGGTIRLSLREVDGPRMHNLEVAGP